MMILGNENCIMIHGCPSDIEKAIDPATRNYDKHWMPWMRDCLVTNGIQTEIPLMPEPWYPDYEKYKKVFEKLEITKDTILVGHSCGCAFLVRWLGESKREISKLILVAPWKIPDSDDPATIAFYTFPIDETVASRVGRIIIFTSDNEEEDGKKSVKMFHDVLGGEIKELKSRGHFVLGDMGTEEFPELLEAILSK
jgi:uncharacterized protein